MRQTIWVAIHPIAAKRESPKLQRNDDSQNFRAVSAITIWGISDLPALNSSQKVDASCRYAKSDPVARMRT
jgi:hypothetical protein